MRPLRAWITHDWFFLCVSASNANLSERYNLRMSTFGMIEYADASPEVHEEENLWMERGEIEDDDDVIALAGVLARAEWCQDDAKTFHRVIYRCLWPSNPELSAADTEVQSTFEKYSAGGEVTGIPSLVEVIDKKVVDTALRWLGIERAQHRNYHWSDTGNADRLATRTGLRIAPQ